MTSLSHGTLHVCSLLIPLILKVDSHLVAEKANYVGVRELMALDILYKERRSVYFPDILVFKSSKAHV